MRDAYLDDLSDFIRNGKLDGYELTDEELAHFLELWRWSVWRRRNHPSAPDYDIIDAVQRLEAHMAEGHRVEVDYNTLLLLRQELEPLMYLRVLWDVPRALGYFLQPANLLALFRSCVRARRYSRIEPLVEGRGAKRGYPKAVMALLRERAPDLVRRKYWSRVGGGERVAQRWW